ncbi:Uncharacterised protein [Rodentibacter pneumotropicus]|uniref:Lipoprotein n=1 Tax=Rodentibacter pneumotropicus TaxID=758 RepID=A0A3S4U8J7_9PAST|nr:Uncharacterised protein [Rodentibacter pneumotropicus]
MKLKSLFLLTVTSLVMMGCSLSNEPSVNPRLIKPSTYSLSIYATDRANINVYSPKDDSVTAVSDEVEMEYSDEFYDTKGKLKRPITIDEYRKISQLIVLIQISKLLSKKKVKQILVQLLLC